MHDGQLKRSIQVLRDLPLNEHEDLCVDELSHSHKKLIYQMLIQALTSTTV